jgi:hypothetical protein
MNDTEVGVEMADCFLVRLQDLADSGCMYLLGVQKVRDVVVTLLFGVLCRYKFMNERNTKGAAECIFRIHQNFRICSLHPTTINKFSFF